jgi:hypothetical protein
VTTGVKLEVDYSWMSRFIVSSRQLKGARGSIEAHDGSSFWAKEHMG